MNENPRREELRQDPVVIDLDKLEHHAESLYLTSFVDAIKEARGTHGRFLTLRAGDELAIRSAQDGSAEQLDQVTVLPAEL